MLTLVKESELFIWMMLDVMVLNLLYLVVSAIVILTVITMKMLVLDVEVYKFSTVFLSHFTLIVCISGNICLVGRVEVCVISLLL